MATCLVRFQVPVVGLTTASQPLERMFCWRHKLTSIVDENIDFTPLVDNITDCFDFFVPNIALAALYRLTRQLRQTSSRCCTGLFFGRQ